jgi:two-component system CheB/CheR fusion protein
MNSGQGPLRILVVDDHVDTAQMLTRLLSRSGYVVRYATGFDSAITAARTERFDLLLCDIGLPDGDGCDLLGQVLALYPVKAIAVTGYGLPNEIDKFKTAGFHAILMKPYDFDRIGEAIAKVTG